MMAIIGMCHPEAAVKLAMLPIHVAFFCWDCNKLIVKFSIEPADYEDILRKNGHDPERYKTGFQTTTPVMASLDDNDCLAIDEAASGQEFCIVALQPGTYDKFAQQSA